jgi:hypothetical protein
VEVFVPASTRNPEETDEKGQYISRNGVTLRSHLYVRTATTKLSFQWTYSWVGWGEGFVQNYGGEISWRAATLKSWKWENDIKIYLKENVCKYE